MDLSDPTTKILIASFGGGIGYELIRRYRRFKANRRARSYGERNSGFWTDGRVYLAEAALLALLLAGPASLLVLAAFDGYSLRGGYLAILAYTALLFLLMKSLNGDPDQ